MSLNLSDLKIIDDLYSEPEKFFDYREQLATVTAKTLVVVGDHDWICPPQQSQLTASLIPNSQLEIIKGANHSVHLEKNEEVINLILQHLSS